MRRGKRPRLPIGEVEGVLDSFVRLPTAATSDALFLTLTFLVFSPRH